MLPTGVCFRRPLGFTLARAPGDHSPGAPARPPGASRAVLPSRSPVFTRPIAAFLGLILLAGCAPKSPSDPLRELDAMIAREKIDYLRARSLLLDSTNALAVLTHRLHQPDYRTAETALTILVHGFGADRTERGTAFVRAALPAVIDLLSSTNVALRSTALWHVGELGPIAAPAVDRLLEVAASPEKPDEKNFIVRPAAVRSLGLIAVQPERCLPVLRTLLHEPNLDLQRFAVEAIGRFEAEASGLRAELETLTGASPPELAEAARTALERTRLPPRPRVGATAPDFVARRLDGTGEVTLSDLRGAYVYLDFWATTCPPCLGPLAACEELAAAPPPADRQPPVRFVAINLDAIPPIGREFIRKRGWTNVLHVSGTEPLTKAYRVGGIPDALLIDPEGRILWRGNPHGLDLRRKLDSLLAGEKP